MNWMAKARAANAELSDPPLPDDEVQRAVRSAWGYKMRDRLMVPGTDGTIILPFRLDRPPPGRRRDRRRAALLALLRKARMADAGRASQASLEAMAQARLT